MADNITVTPGTGANVAFDEVTTLNGGTVAAVKVQRVKVMYGVDGTATGVLPTAGLPIQGSQAAASTTAWTSATSVSTANSISVTGMNTVSVAIVTTSTFTGGVVTFEVSPDGTNWGAVALAPLDRFATDLTYTFVASQTRAWSTSVDGFTNFRVRLSTAITGTGTATIIVIPQTFAIEPIVNAGIASRTIGGLTTHTLISAATTNATAIKTSPGTVYSVQASNSGAGNAFVKFYNKASAPTVGTDVAVKTIMVPAGGGFTAAIGDGIGAAFPLGIAMAITGVATTADATAVAAAQVVVNTDYA